MKKTLLTLLLLILVFVSKVDSATVNKIVGLNADCGGVCKQIPLNAMVLCNTFCPYNTAPSFTDEKRLWGSGDVTGCMTSVNGGVTWSGCYTEPFFYTMSQYAGTADGAVIGVAKLSSPDRTSIKKSTDNGVTWNTVYEDTVNIFDGSTLTNTRLRCFLDGYCFLIGRDSLDGHFFILESMDNGQTWSVVFTKNHNDPPGISNGQLYATQIKDFIDHTVIASPPNTYSTSVRGIMKVNNVWGITSLLGSGSITCWGSFIFNNTPYGMCYTLGSRKIVNLTTGLVEKTPTFNPSIFAGSDKGGMSYGYDSTTIYSLQKVIVNSVLRTGIYVSKDSGSSFIRIFTVSMDIQQADFWKHPINGCLYWSGGVSTIVVGRIC